MTTTDRLARAGTALAWCLLAASGCCFAPTDRTVDIDMPAPALPPPDPSLEALRVCLTDAIPTSCPRTRPRR